MAPSSPRKPKPSKKAAAAKPAGASKKAAKKAATAKPERATGKTTTKPAAAKKAAPAKPERAPKKAAKKAAAAKLAPASKKAAAAEPARASTKKAATAKPARAPRTTAKKAGAGHTGLQAFADACEMGYVVHAFRADLDAIVAAVKAQPEFVAHARDVGASSLAQATSPRLGERDRSTFLVELDGSPWRLWYGATNWLERADSRLARLAGRVAEQLEVRAISVSASDEAGEIQVYDEGEQVGAIEDTVGPEVDALFAEAELSIPPALIGDHPAELCLDDAVLPQVSRVDRLDLRAAEGKKERVRHPFTGKMVEMEFD